MGAGPPLAGYLYLGPNHPSTIAFRAYLARSVGGQRQEELLSSALQLDHAVIAGSAVFAGALLRDCTWNAGDLDIFASSPVESLVLKFQSVDVGRPVSALFDDPLEVGDTFEYRGSVTLGKWIRVSVMEIRGKDVLVDRVSPWGTWEEYYSNPDPGHEVIPRLTFWVRSGAAEGDISRRERGSNESIAAELGTITRALPIPLTSVARCFEWIAERASHRLTAEALTGVAGARARLSGSKRSASAAGLPSALAAAGLPSTLADACLPGAAAGLPSVPASADAGLQSAAVSLTSAPAGLPSAPAGLLCAATGLPGTQVQVSRHSAPLAGVLAAVQAAQYHLIDRHYDRLRETLKDPRRLVCGERFAPSSVAHVLEFSLGARLERSAGSVGAVPAQSVQLIQTSHASPDYPHRVVESFDLTCCMAAYDGEGIWVAADAVPPGAGEADWPLAHNGPGGPRVAINRPGISGWTYWPLLRTARRVRKYAARGLAVSADDEAWLRAELQTRATSPGAIERACMRGRLQEAVALLRAGAAAPVEQEARAWKPRRDVASEAEADEFCTKLEAAARIFTSEHATIARAFIAASRASRGMRASLCALPPELSRQIANFLGGSDSETLVEAAAAARSEWAAFDEQFVASLSAGPLRPWGPHYY